MYFDYLLESSEKAKHSGIIIYEDRELSSFYLFKKSAGLIKILKDFGLQKGDLVALLFDNSPEFLISVLALSALGCISVPLNPDMKKSQTENILKNYGIRYLISKESLEFEGVKNVFFNIESLPEENPYKVPKRDVEPDFPLLLSVTSGSTSKPKPIVLSHKCKIQRAKGVVIDLYNIDKENTLIVSTPVYHTLGFRLLTIPLYVGSKAVLLKRFTEEVYLRKVEQYKVNFSILVSNQIESLMKYMGKNNISFPKSLKVLVASSSKLTPYVREWLMGFEDMEIYEMYGTSETSTATSINLKKEKDKYLSVGKAIKDVDIRILKQGEEDVGEIAIKTPYMFSGYFGMEDATRSSFTQDGYFLTGDIGYIDQDGYLYYKGRKKFIYKVGAINVYPEDIEEVLLQNPKVKECVVVGIERGSNTELVALYVSEEDIKEWELRSFCMQRLATYQVPIKYVRVEEVPKLSVGKIDRRQATELCRQIIELRS